MNVPQNPSAAVPSSKYLDLARKIKEIEMVIDTCYIMQNYSNSFRRMQNSPWNWKNPISTFSDYALSEGTRERDLSSPLHLFFSILMEKLTEIEPKMSKSSNSNEIKEEILKEMEKVVTEEAEDNGN